MRVYVAGGTGRLGKAVVNKLRYYDFDVDSQYRDITDKTKLEDLKGFDVIINAAAYTNVDMAEDEDALKCWAVNSKGVVNLIDLATRLNAKMVHISTDFVFDGMSGRPYIETDKPNPKGSYARSKLCGEESTLKYHNSLVLRTGWLYDDDRLRDCMDKPFSKGVVDKFLSPTSVYSLAEMIASLIRTEHHGLYHATDTGFTTPFCLLRELGLNPEPVGLNDFNLRLSRPPNTALDNSKLKQILNIPTWKQALKSRLMLL